MIQMAVIKDNFEYGDEVYVEIKTIFGNCYTHAKIIYIYKTLSGIFKKHRCFGLYIPTLQSYSWGVPSKLLKRKEDLPINCVII